ATSVRVGELYTYNIVVNDPDLPYGDQLDIIAASLPTWLSLTDNGNGTAMLSGTPAIGDAGNHLIHIDAEDIYHHGNPTHSDQEFTIQVIACTTNLQTKNIIVALDDNGTVSISETDVDDGSTDDCGIQSMSVSPHTFNCSNVGPNSVVLGLTNIYGITTTKTATVAVVDNLPPVITCPIDRNVDLNSNCQFIVPDMITGLTGNDNCSGTVTFTQNTAAGTLLSSAHNQTHSVIITANDGSGNSSPCTVVLTGKD